MSKQSKSGYVSTGGVRPCMDGNLEAPPCQYRGNNVFARPADPKRSDRRPRRLCRVQTAEKTEVPPSLVLRLQGARAAARHIRLGLFEGENERKVFSGEEDLLHITDTWMMMLMMPYVACFFDLHYMSTC